MNVSKLNYPAVHISFCIKVAWPFTWHFVRWILAVSHLGSFIQLWCWVTVCVTCERGKMNCLLAWFFWIGQLVTIIACKYMLAWCMIKKIKHQFDKGCVLCIALCRHRLGCWNEWRNHPSSRPVIFFWNGLVVFSFLKWSAGQPSRPQPALDDCQQKLLEELLQHFETGVLWLQVWYYFLFRCLVIYTSNILRLMVQGRVLWFQWSLQLGAWHIYIYISNQELCFSCTFDYWTSLAWWSQGPQPICFEYWTAVYI